MLSTLAALAVFASSAYAGQTDNVVYIIDTSCSMDGGFQLQRAKAEVNEMIDELRNDQHFDVVAAACVDGTCSEVLWGQARRATPAARDQARSYVESLHAMGGSGLGAAVARALTEPAFYGVFEYFLVTDGSPNCLVGFGQGTPQDTAQSCLDSGYNWGGDQDHLNVIAGANTKGAVVHVRLVDPESAFFGENVAAQNGPGSCEVVQ